MTPNELTKDLQERRARQWENYRGVSIVLECLALAAGCGCVAMWAALLGAGL